MSQLLLEAIGQSKTITCAILGSSESLNKNKIGKTGQEPLYRMVQNNKILTILNIQNTNLMNSGLKRLAEGLSEGSPLFCLNIGCNELTHQSMGDLEIILSKCQ